jgi:hypothetical protein
MRGNSAQLEEHYADDDFETEDFVKPTKHEAVRKESALMQSLDPSA